MKPFLPTCVLAAFLVPFAAHATTIVDQSNGPDGNSYAFGENMTGTIGQSFTPTLAGITFATFELGDTSSTSVDALMYSGAGAGTLLATSSAVTVSGSNYAVYTFQFAPTALTPGAVYTLALQNLSSNVLYVDATPDNYANGQAYQSGVAQSRIDLVFAEGVKTPLSATPEPSGLLLVGTGLAGVAGMVRRRLRRA